MTEHQKYVAELAAQILSGIISGRMASNQNFDLGNIRPLHIQGAINIAAGLVQEVAERIPPEPPASR